MKRFMTDFFSVPTERKVAVKEIAIEIERLVKVYYSTKTNYFPSISEKLDKAYALYRRKYEKDLTNEEKSIFFLYILFPNDEYFDELIMRYDKDFKRISMLYAINQIVVKMRYLLENNIKLETEELVTENEDVITKKKQ